jgi:hypothetical protein
VRLVCEGGPNSAISSPRSTTASAHRSWLEPVLASRPRASRTSSGSCVPAAPVLVLPQRRQLRQHPGLVDEEDQTIRFGSVRYSTHRATRDAKVWCRVVGG